MRASTSVKKLKAGVTRSDFLGFELGLLIKFVPSAISALAIGGFLLPD